MPNSPIDLEIVLVEEAMNHSELMITEIMKAARVGFSHEWYLDNWRSVVLSKTDATLSDLDLIEPWIETWINEAYHRVEMENK